MSVPKVAMNYPAESESIAKRDSYMFQLHVFVKDIVVARVHVEANTFEEAKHILRESIHIECATLAVPFVVIAE